MATALSGAEPGGRTVHTNLQQFQATGLVKRVDAAARRVVISHDPIPGFMEAMTMTFEVKEQGDLSGVEAGQRIRFRLWVGEESGWVDQIRPEAEHLRPGQSGEAGAVLEAVPPGLSWVKPLRVGEMVPATWLTNQDGRGVRLSDFRGKAVAMTFLFTRCPYPEFCPRMTRNLARAGRDLRATPGITNWHLISVSFDPAHDTPSVLHAYARAQTIDSSQWSLVTGDPKQVDLFCQGFGLYFTRDAETLVHNLVTVVIDPRGRVRRYFQGNQWKPEELVDEVLSAANEREHAGKP
jgi:protein SCO1/2